jgi:hypothetical protein
MINFDRTRRWRTRVTALVLFTALLAGCATKSFQRPADFDFAALRERATTVVEESIQVSAAIPSHEEINTIFGVDLASKSIQPVWLEIENPTERRLHFLRTGLDPEYFSPREVAFLFHGSLSEQDKKQLSWHLEWLNFENPIEPGSTASGFVYANEDRETKFVSVDLFSPGWSKHTTLLVPTPERTLTEDQIERFNALIGGSSSTEVEDESELHIRLEKLPCCAASEHGIQAEPFNVVLIGNLEAVAAALLRRGFRYSPASPLYAFGRSQDWSARKAAGWVEAQPHVLRLWVTGFQFRGKMVWVGHISTPLGGRFATAESEESPARIDPDVDEARNDLVQDAIFSQLLTQIGFVKGVGAVAPSSPRTTPDGSEYYTDGLRAVLIFDNEPVSMTEIQFLGWEALADHYRR